MIKFTGQTKEATNGHVKASTGYRCDCHKCKFHDQYPHLVGQPLTPQQFLQVNPIVNPPVPTDYGPEIAQLWADAEAAREEWQEADRVWERALAMQSKARLKQSWQPMILHPTGNMIPNPVPKPAGNLDDADEAVRIAKEARDEADRKWLQANSRHMGMLRVWEQRKREAEDAERQAERDAAEEVEKTRKRRWMLGQIGK